MCFAAPRMKLRIRANTIRLRLTQGEVQRLASGERIEERTTFEGGAVLAYAISSSEIAAPRASFAGGAVEVVVPRGAVGVWAASDRVGIEGGHGALSILVEKDFACLTPRVHEDDDAFPNPNATC